MELIDQYFPDLDALARERLARLGDIYADWNSKVNLISRKDMEHFYERHVLHSLCIAMCHQIQDGAEVVDVGTGGGFPGIPLAIVFPNVQFTMVDSIRKKIKVVDDVIETLGLENAKAEACRMEEHKHRYDYVTGRAVTALPRLYGWTKHLVHWGKGKDKAGMLYLKGGDFYDELDEIKAHHQLHYLNEKIDLPFYETKRVVQLFK